MALGGCNGDLNHRDPSRRLRAVHEWAEKNPPVALPPASDNLERTCARIRAPEELRCPDEAWLCRTPGDMGGFCSGRYFHEEWLVFASGEWNGRDALPEAGSASALIGYRSGTSDFLCEELEDPEEAQVCRERAAARLTEIDCDVLLVNPCRGELYSRCRGRAPDGAPEELQLGRIRVTRWDG